MYEKAQNPIEPKKKVSFKRTTNPVIIVSRIHDGLAHRINEKKNN